MKAHALLSRNAMFATLLLAAGLSLSATPAPNDSVKAELEAVAREVGEKISKIALTRVSDAIEMSDTVLDNDTANATQAGGSTTIIINQKVANPDDITALAERRQSRTASQVIALGIIVPCATIIFIVLALLIFLLVRGYNRNRIISEAIRNNYQLPDSFYTGTSSKPQPEYVEVADTQRAETSHEESKLPPLPRVPLTQVEKDYLSKSLILAGVGLLIFLFFLWCSALGVGLLAGGIPFVVGASRVAVFYINRR